MATQKTTETKKKPILVIVESPTKAGSIKSYLGANYQLEASEGHIRDLPKSTLGVDVENDFEKTVFATFPALQSIKEQLYRDGAIYAAMSGSGSAMFGIFPK